MRACSWMPSCEQCSFSGKVSSTKRSEDPFAFDEVDETPLQNRSRKRAADGTSTNSAPKVPRFRRSDATPCSAASSCAGTFADDRTPDHGGRSAVASYRKAVIPARPLPRPQLPRPPRPSLRRASPRLAVPEVKPARNQCNKCQRPSATCPTECLRWL